MTPETHALAVGKHGGLFIMRWCPTCKGDGLVKSADFRPVDLSEPPAPAPVILRPCPMCKGFGALAK